ncbi:MAG: 3'(2'),5'-bisphosphate nucleotidase CysQ family protein, partial [Pseudomonadaceae bacterium]
MSHPYLPAVIELVRAAGAAILPYWRRELAVQTKADESPVTAADMAAHRLLFDGLTALDPGIPVLSEEDCALPLAERAGWTRWWLVDPLDGTKEFIAG